ncbi:cytosine deaminase [Alsobacter sp. R-9]
MAHGFATVPHAPAFRLSNATLPAALVDAEGLPAAGDGLVRANLHVGAGRIEAIVPPGEGAAGLPAIDLDRGMAWPGFVDAHTHLDKGHIWPRAANPDGSFMGALTTVMADRETNWSAADVTARMDFGLRCAYAHGTVAIRTHIDSRIGQTGVSFPVFAAMREKWAGKVALQASPLFGIELALDEAHMADVVANVSAHGSGILGAVTYGVPQLKDGLALLFRTAAARGWDLDFHVDETLDPGATSLRLIAETALAHAFEGRILVGHCCSLSVHAEDEAARTMDLVARAGIAVVSLPMCNMYLQSRAAGVTPRRRGVTLLHEMKARGVTVMVASDNTRDPFYAYGDLDLLEVYREATRIAHFDHPVADWPGAVTSAPAAALGIDRGRIRVGEAADLVLFRARNWTELLSRPQSDRTVLRHGKAIDTTLPDYRELDAVVGA